MSLTLADAIHALTDDGWTLGGKGLVSPCSRYSVRLRVAQSRTAKVATTLWERVSGGWMDRTHATMAPIPYGTLRDLQDDIACACRWLDGCRARREDEHRRFQDIDRGVTALHRLAVG
jgi:hypothetical protein